jgi:hypothetical protein
VTKPTARQITLDSQRKLSSGVISLSVILSLVHLLNFINYTRLSGYFDPPLTRSALLVASAIFVLVGSTAHIGLHFRRSWDMYAICGLAIMSAIFSKDASRTLMYSMWLTLAVFLATELALRIRTSRDVVSTLGIVLLPASFLVGIANVTLGPIVDSTERRFGALGSQHVDTAYAMNYFCLFLALRALPRREYSLPGWWRLPMLGLLAWAVYQMVFGLTRSVWLGGLMALVMYLLRARANLKTFALVLFSGALVAIVVSSVGIERIVPKAVSDRVQVTEQRYEAGQIDPRVKGIRNAITTAMAQPQGIGYASSDSHNSYLNILVQLGWAGFMLAIVAVLRSALMVWRMGAQWLLFFSIGAGALLLHAFFEVQNTPGQANFIPLLTWYALSRAHFVRAPSRDPNARPKFVDTRANSSGVRNERI